MLYFRLMTHSKIFLRGLFISLLVVACSAPASPQVKKISNQELVELMDNDELQLVDVRTPDEVADKLSNLILNGLKK